MGNQIYLEVENLSKTESAAAEILRHIAAIRELEHAMLGSERISAELKIKITEEKE